MHNAESPEVKLRGFLVSQPRLTAASGSSGAVAFRTIAFARSAIATLGTIAVGSVIAIRTRAVTITVRARTVSFKVRSRTVAAPLGTRTIAFTGTKTGAAATVTRASTFAARRESPFATESGVAFTLRPGTISTLALWSGTIAAELTTTLTLAFSRRRAHEFARIETAVVVRVEFVEMIDRAAEFVAVQRTVAIGIHEAEEDRSHSPFARTTLTLGTRTITTFTIGTRSIAIRAGSISSFAVRSRTVTALPVRTRPITTLTIGTRAISSLSIRSGTVAAPFAAGATLGQTLFQLPQVEGVASSLVQQIVEAFPSLFGDFLAGDDTVTVRVEAAQAFEHFTAGGSASRTTFAAAHLLANTQELLAGEGLPAKSLEDGSDSPADFLRQFVPRHHAVAVTVEVVEQPFGIHVGGNAASLTGTRFGPHFRLFHRRGEFGCGQAAVVVFVADAHQPFEEGGPFVGDFVGRHLAVAVGIELVEEGSGATDLVVREQKCPGAGERRAQNDRETLHGIASESENRE
jgi:hypothetical protein